MDPLEALRNALRGRTIGTLPALPAEPNFEYAVARFLRALSDCGPGPDAAVLLRQAVRWFPGPLSLPPLPPELTTYLALVGLEQTPDGIVAATPFLPTWLPDDALPSSGLDAAPHCARPDEAVPAESFLRELGTSPTQPEPRYPRWQSPAQKEAAWRVLGAPQGSTTLVVLPTGTGKSLLFQLLARLSVGLTVVVVPTVALAIDQYENARGAVPELNPVYYASRDDPDAVVAAVKDQQSRLVFTSPEACVSGRLRSVLHSLAAAGSLDNLVIDEVHIVESWGAFFRVDFQLLAGVRQSWMVGAGARLRTLLLTATLTEVGRADLRQLFPPVSRKPWVELVSQRLRPEMVYFDRCFTDAANRDTAVADALWQLPRPAILYVTEVDEARAWHRRLRQDLKFQRVGCFHGETSPRERRLLLENWRANALDLMVATSAFGLGVDKPDVRAVVHACFPEDMNRYYQEVGRGGRDGWSAACLLLPTQHDREVALGLGPKYMTAKLLQERWQALWASRRPSKAGDYVWKLNTAAVRDGMLGQRTGGENVRWNKRLLLQLHRANRLQLLDVEYEYPEDEDVERIEWLEVRLGLNPDSPLVGASVEATREEELAESARGLQMVQAYLTGQECIARVLRRLYGPGTQRVCAGCRFSRCAREEPRECPPLRWERPTPPPFPRAVLVGRCPDAGKGGGEAFAAFVRGCLERRVYRFVAGQARVAGLLPLFDRLFAELPAYLRQPYRLDGLGELSELLEAETAVLFHFGRLEEAGLRLRGGRTVIHCFAPPLTAQELRYALPPETAAELEFHEGPESWLTS